MKETVTTEGLVESVVFHNPENGYTVLSLSDDEGLSELTCVGYMPSPVEGERLRVTGSYVNNPRYGTQLSIESYDRVKPETAQGMEKYLGSGIIKGIGERLAKRIVKTFGGLTFDVMEKTPVRLAEIKGITVEKALSFGVAFIEQRDLRQAMVFLQEYGVSPANSIKIFKKYGSATIEAVKKNPYSLADDITGIGFRTADEIAGRVGVAFDSSYRISAGIRHILEQAANNGHVYLPIELLTEYARELLNVPGRVIDDNVACMQADRIIMQDAAEGGLGRAVYLSAFYYVELYVAKKILELSRITIDKRELAGEEISKAEATDGIMLAEGQRAAVTEALINGALIITGGPGTGKTTAINTIIGIMKREGLRMELAAPTGRAAKRMSEATGMEAKTIHRLLEIEYLSEDGRRQTFAKNDENPIEADAVIIDESSMVDILLMNSLLKAVAAGTRLILVGDADQLPSVGPGNVLKDIMNSGCVKVVRLTEIFRQARESDIIMNAHMINEGVYPKLDGKEKDFFFIRKNSAQDVADTVADLAARRIPSYINGSVVHDVQVLTPMKKSVIGVSSLNQSLQGVINPPSPEKREREYRSAVFREGDKVMQIKNNYNLAWRVRGSKGALAEEGLGVYNGDVGVIKEIDEESERLTVVFDEEKYVEYDFQQLEELELAYAVTIHKSQGSEYRAVIIPIHSGPPMLMSRNLLYTAVTRARELAVIVGIPETLYKMVDNDKEIGRYTSLTKRIVSLSRFMDESDEIGGGSYA